MKIDMKLVKELNDATGAGLMACKKALEEAEGDVKGAEKILKEKGLASVAKRADKAAGEGRIFIKQNGNKIVIVELVCETDFVANGEGFIACGEAICKTIFEKGYTKIEQELSDMALDYATRVHENMSLKTVEVIDVPAGATAGMYVHSDNKTGAVVIIKGSEADAVKVFAKDCCMHLAAFTPAYITKDEIPESYIAEQKEIFLAKMNNDEKMASKPDNVKEGIIAGQIKKHLAEISFVDQGFVKDPSKTVSAKLAEVGKEVGADLSFGYCKVIVLGK